MPDRPPSPECVCVCVCLADWVCVVRLPCASGLGLQGVVYKFQQQLAELLAIVESSETHFVRCIKPNTVKTKRIWEDEMVSKQLKCSGIMEAVRVIAAGYPDRVPHSEVLGRFAALISPDERPSPDKEGEKAAASKVLAILKLDLKEYVAGNTKMFLKAGTVRPVARRNGAVGGADSGAIESPSRAPLRATAPLPP